MHHCQRFLKLKFTLFERNQTHCRRDTWHKSGAINTWTSGGTRRNWCWNRLFFSDDLAENCSKQLQHSPLEEGLTAPLILETICRYDQFRYCLHCFRFCICCSSMQIFFVLQSIDFKTPVWKSGFGPGGVHCRTRNKHGSSSQAWLFVGQSVSCRYLFFVWFNDGVCNKV